MDGSPSPELLAGLQNLVCNRERHEDPAAFFTALFRFLEDHATEIEQWLERLSEERLMQLARVFFLLAARPTFRVFERRMEFFEMAQAMGVHVLPNHFYGPAPDTSKLPPSTWTRRFDATPGWRLDAEAQLPMLEALGRWSDELVDIPQDEPEGGGFYWGSGAIPAADAATYYAMIREFRPRQILEIGCGYSTLIAARACARNGEGELHGVDPYPAACLRQLPTGPASVTESAAQEVPFARFEALERGDILFIDSTHVSKIGSDVNYLVLEVLPRLRSGVLVHLHDIFLPWEMPERWVVGQKLFWNEQYLLLAFLMFNHDFETLLSSHYLAHEYPAEFEQAFPFGPADKAASYWMRRV